MAGSCSEGSIWDSGLNPGGGFISHTLLRTTTGRRCSFGSGLAPFGPVFFLATCNNKSTKSTFLGGDHTQGESKELIPTCLYSTSPLICRIHLATSCGGDRRIKLLKPCSCWTSTWSRRALSLAACKNSMITISRWLGCRGDQRSGRDKRHILALIMAWALSCPPQ